MEPAINSFNNKININNSVNNCDIHIKENIILLCTDCKVGVCRLCIVYNHNCHSFEEINIKKILLIKNLINETKEDQLNIMGYKESDSHVMNAIEYCFTETAKNAQENINIIKKKTQMLSYLFQNFANQWEKIIITEQSINENLYLSLQTEFNQNKENYDLLLKDCKKIMNSNFDQLLEDFDENELDQINKNIKQLLKNKKSRDLIEQFKIHTINFNENIYNEIINLLNSLFILIKEDYKDKDKDNPYKQDLMINKYFNPILCQYYICHGEPVPDNVFEVAYDSNYIHPRLNTPKHVTKISLYNGFKLNLDENCIPNWINTLVVWNTLYPLKPNSIPKSVNELYIRNGYSHLITFGTIPDSVRELFICDIKYPLLKGSIGKNVEILKIRNGYNHPITEGVIGNSVSLLYFGKLGNTSNSTILTNETIPKFGKLESIHFLHDFNQPIPDNFIPKSSSTPTITLEFYAIDQIRLFKNGIPSHIKKVVLHNHIKYKDLINTSLINSSIKIEYL